LKKNIALNLWKFLTDSSVLKQFEGSITYQSGQPLSGFHQWADGQPTVGIVFLKHPIYDNGLFFLLIRWKAGQSSRLSDEYYLVLFPQNRQRPYVQIWKIRKDDPGFISLLWEYAPRKRDNKNLKRKQYFQTHFKSTNIVINIPGLVSDVPDFIEECFILVDNRLRADALDGMPPIDRDGFPEGKLYEKRHKIKERDPRLGIIAKERFKVLHGRLYCLVCSFDFENKYGSLGKDFIEAHHITPVSQLRPGSITRVEDIVLVCANCHRMLHKKRPWVKVSKLKTILKV